MQIDASDSSRSPAQRLRALVERSPRKALVARLVARVYTNPMIAAQMGRSVHDVHKLLQQIYDEVGVHRRGALAILYHEVFREDYPFG
jgi:DNA-binding NarL/FixJ family response regulator